MREYEVKINRIEKDVFKIEISCGGKIIYIKMEKMKDQSMIDAIIEEDIFGSLFSIFDHIIDNLNEIINDGEFGPASDDYYYRDNSGIYNLWIYNISIR